MLNCKPGCGKRTAGHQARFTNGKDSAMSLTQLSTRAQIGINAPEVRVEVHISSGLPAFTVVGLPETAVREAARKSLDLIDPSRP